MTIGGTFRIQIVQANYEWGGGQGKIPRWSIGKLFRKYKLV